jgi:murein hydrolase activator
MIAVRRAAGIAAAAALIVFAALAARAAPADAPVPAAGASALDALRQQCVAAARDERQQEAAVAALQHQVDLLAADAAGRQRDLDDSRPEQAHLLGVLAFLAGNLGNPLTAAAASEPPLDRLRGALLISAVAPELRAEARALMAEINETARLRREEAARRRDLVAAQAALARDRDRLALLVTQRLALIRQFTPDAVAVPDLARIAGAAKDIGDLIRLVDAAAERRGGTGRGALAARTGADPIRPTAPQIFDPPQSALLLPVSGTIAGGFGDPGAVAGTLNRGLQIAAGLPRAEVVAPFAGEVVYAGPFRDYGLVLIIRHGALYHSLLAGLGRVDAGADEWVLAGEPVGAMPDVAAPNPATPAAQAEEAAGGLLYFELRRDGQPVDPQPWLAKRDEANGEQRVRQ